MPTANSINIKHNANPSIIANMRIVYTLARFIHVDEGMGSNLIYFLIDGLTSHFIFATPTTTIK
jgi:hypothetical protein